MKKGIFSDEKHKIHNFFYSSDTNNMNIKNFSRKLIISALFTVTSLLIFSCKTIPHAPQELSRSIMSQGKLNAKQLTAFFLSRNPDADKKHITQFAQYYINEAAAEGINSDVAFAQMCLETGFLKFGGLVQPEFHNYCGLGAMDADHPGEQFETEELGVRAHIQHLQAYATTEDIKLHKELVDPRYNWVHKTKYIEDIFGLTGTWAADPHYGEKIDGLLTAMEIFSR